MSFEKKSHMKTLLTVVIMMLCYSVSNSQSVGDVQLADINAEYIQVTFEEQIGSKVSVHLDFGQANPEYNPRETQLRHQGKKEMVFNSMMDAINYLSGYGYKLEQVYTITKDTASTPFYILRKEEKNI